MNDLEQRKIIILRSEGKRDAALSFYPSGGDLHSLLRYLSVAKMHHAP